MSNNLINTCPLFQINAISIPVFCHENTWISTCITDVVLSCSKIFLPIPKDGNSIISSSGLVANFTSDP